MKKFLFLGLFMMSFIHVAAKFNPVTYMPPIKKISISPDKCPVQINVSPKGTSLEDACEKICQMKKKGRLPKGGIVVNIQSGDYVLDKPLLLGKDNSGTKDAPVIYRGIGKVRLLGAKKIDGNDFKVVKDSKALKRIDKDARGKIMELDLKALNLSHCGPYPDVFNDGGGIFELLINGKRMPLSRWPDDGYTTMKEVVVNGDKKIPGKFIYRDNRPSRWAAAKNIWLKGFWRVGWENPAIKVASIDTIAHQIDFAAGIQAGIGSKYKRPKGSGEEEWYAINLLEEITEPGEWCIDFNTHKLYLYPSVDMKKADILITQQERPLIEGTELENVSFVNLTFEASLGDGISIVKGKEDLIAGCRFNNLAGRGVVLDGEYCGIQSNDMYNLGKGCIVISGGNRQTLTPSCNYIINNHLHNYGVLKSQYSAAIDLYSDSKGAPAVGIYIAHNVIHHGPRDAVLLAGNLNVFEYNKIYRCAYSTADTGAFYSWSDWTIRGAIMRFNHIFDTVGGYNPDDGAAGGFFYGNVLEGERTGVWIASGPDNVIKNNIFVKESGPVYGGDDRGISRGYATNKRMWDKVRSIDFNDTSWKEYFPEMNHFLDSHPELPQRNSFEGNIVWIKKGNPVSLKMKKENASNPDLVRVENNFVTDKNPGFADCLKGNYKLLPSSPVKKQIPDFPMNLDTSKMGLVIDQYRKTLPSSEELGLTPQQSPWKNVKKSGYFAT
jgi:hypothetical protein